MRDLPKRKPRDPGLSETVMSLPPGHEPIGLSDLGENLTIKQGELYWKGHRVETQLRVSRGTAALGIFVAVATLLNMLVGAVKIGFDLYDRYQYPPNERLAPAAPPSPPALPPFESPQGNTDGAPVIPDLPTHPVAKPLDG